MTLTQCTDLDVPVVNGEPEEDQDGAHDEARDAQEDAALQPVELQHAGAVVLTRVAAWCTWQALEGHVVDVLQILPQNDNRNSIVVSNWFENASSLLPSVAQIVSENSNGNTVNTFL